MKTLGVVSVALVLAAGCSREVPAEKIAALTAQATQLNAKLPKELSGKLELVAGADADKRAAIIFPRGWEGGGMGGYRPPANSGLGAFTSYGVSYNCNGTCEAKDWAAAFESVDVAPLRAGSAKIEKDEKLGDGGRVVVAKDGELTLLRVGLWKQGASRYFHCTADIDSPLEGAAAVIEEACRATTVVHW